MKLPFTFMIAAALALPPATSAEDAATPVPPVEAAGPASAVPAPRGLELPLSGFS